DRLTGGHQRAIYLQGDAHGHGLGDPRRRLHGFGGGIRDQADATTELQAAVFVVLHHLGSMT
ncbi:hypothetical protein, partial [Xanthomonas euvesicatoria]|uniref:hypothetical protein n=1 Tax=Xanthomonas euvesicatoria TaxID=456327 RepID=UPI003B671C48